MTAAIPPPDDRCAVPSPPGQLGLPRGFRVTLDPGVRRRRRPDGGVLLGGSPLRVLRLNEAAWRRLGRLAAGCPVDDVADGVVASRVVDAGLAQPEPPPGGPGPQDVTVVIPVRDRPPALARCLRAVGPAAEVLVVDDASRDPEPVRRVVADAGARLVTRQVNGGPAAARNTGLAGCATPYVAFVDSDCEPEPGWLTALMPHFADPRVAAVAPRIRGLDRPGWLGRYEQVRSSLDLGDRPGPVRPRSAISYVPAAALVARRAALGTGFAEALTVGEDVDLVWRLHAGGWRVR
ncbi:MAG: glycosyltransferase [Dermatophilaceae bacterium]